ncbi:hypothetical protein [Aurantimonas coralicida]|uniref:hypothetical protein n=1 Tax=Aurantimonas coralicida TaxID=182270 RepID=UPI001D186598|nr:hypothetical protein [Aurantimonas coralicida]MCC4299842.1 hypothetical protein [Aurantimonas coralicida]
MPDINGSYERLAMPTRVSWKGREWYDGFHGDSAGSCLSAFGPLLPPANGLGAEGDRSTAAATQPVSGALWSFRVGPGSGLEDDGLLGLS